MAKPVTRKSLARRLTGAAVALTGDDPLKGITVDALARQLGLKDRVVIDQGIEVARQKGWLDTSGGPHPHSISVTATGHAQRRR